MEEDFFSRLVELNRLRSKARLREKKIYFSGKDPDREIIFPSESRGGMMQIVNKVKNLIWVQNQKKISYKNFQVCDNCGEEFCDKRCEKIYYDDSKVKNRT